jgi:hypothetical protein
MLQALCIKMLFDKIRVLRAEFKEHPTLKDKFRCVCMCVCVCAREVRCYCGAVVCLCDPCLCVCARAFLCPRPTGDRCSESQSCTSRKRRAFAGSCTAASRHSSTTKS